MVLRNVGLVCAAADSYVVGMGGLPLPFCDAKPWFCVAGLWHAGGNGNETIVSPCLLGSSAGLMLRLFQRISMRYQWVPGHMFRFVI